MENPSILHAHMSELFKSDLFVSSGFIILRSWKWGSIFKEQNTGKLFLYYRLSSLQGK